MNRTLVSLLAPGLLALASTNLAAQTNPCDANYYPITFVDALGSPATTVDGVAYFASEQVYISFASLPDGNYDLYVHVTDRLNGVTDEVLSMNDPADRFVRVEKTSGITKLALPASSNPDPDAIVTLADGNEILLITPVRNAVTEPCLFKAWVGDTFQFLNFGDASWPYIVRTSTPSQCTLASYAYFRIGDTIPGSDVRGSAFEDSNRDCIRDPGEAPLVGWQVRLVSESSTPQTAYTDSNGDYVFPNIGTGNFTVEFVLPAGFAAGTTSAYAVDVCGCADLDLGDFCASRLVQDCNARTIGFWRNKHGVELVQRLGILATLPALCLADADGTMGASEIPATVEQWRSYLKNANSTNMAYMLSAQLAAMHCNVAAGHVGLHCVIEDPVLGIQTIQWLILEATDSLCAPGGGETRVGSTARERQTLLKNALDNANNNRNWL